MSKEIRTIFFFKCLSQHCFELGKLDAPYANISIPHYSAHRSETLHLYTYFTAIHTFKTMCDCIITCIAYKSKKKIKD